MIKLRVLLCGSDGYLGFCFAQRLLDSGYEVFGVDCFHRRRMVEEVGGVSAIPISSVGDRVSELKRRGDFGFRKLNIAEDYEGLKDVFQEFSPDVVVNLAQQPSPAYSMSSPKHGNFTQNNNINGLLNICWCMHKFAPKSHLVTLGTMGEWDYNINMPIPEGFFRVEFKGYTDVLPFPRQGSSIYHVSKIQASQNTWFACRVWELMATDIHQGVVYGTRIPEMNEDVCRTRFDFDESFGTAINRFVSMAVCEEPIFVYGSGSQIRSYIALTDSIECMKICAENPPTDEDSFHGYRVINQFDEYYSLNQLASLVRDVAGEFGLETRVKHISNPRIEAEYHFYEPIHEKLYDMGWQPSRGIEDTLREMFEDLIPFKERLIKYKHNFLPSIKWRK